MYVVVCRIVSCCCCAARAWAVLMERTMMTRIQMAPRSLPVTVPNPRGATVVRRSNTNARGKRVKVVFQALRSASWYSVNNCNTFYRHSLHFLIKTFSCIHHAAFEQCLAMFFFVFATYLCAICTVLICLLILVCALCACIEIIQQSESDAGVSTCLQVIWNTVATLGHCHITFCKFIQGSRFILWHQMKISVKL